MKKRFSKKERKILLLTRKVTVLLFCTCMLVGTGTGMLIFARPSQSVTEKRTLTAFPSFSFSSFLDGSWFSQIALWYSDTYPGRDSFVAMSNKLKNMEGIGQDEMVIGGAQADAIGATDSNQTSQTAQNFEQRTEVPDMNLLQDDIQGQIMEGLLVKDGAAYGGCYFVQESHDQFASAAARAAHELEGITDVYSIIVPNNSYVMLDDETYKKLSGSDQKQVIDYYYSSFDPLIKPVTVYKTLRDHNNENVYFKTDHHWTQLGAYYAYEEFCKVKGIEPVNKDDLEYARYEPFYGSYINMLPGVEFSPDVFEEWVPEGGNVLKVFADGVDDPNSDQYYEDEVVNNKDGIDQYNHYMRLLAGDLPFCMIDNDELDDGSSCLVIKESYGDAFVPWLCNNYDKVYVMDIRYSDYPIVTFCRENQVDDLILINNVQLINGSAMAQMYDARLR